MKVAVAQLGARMHWAVPSILAGADCLELLYTDLAFAEGGLAAKVLRRVAKRGIGLRRLAGRIVPGVGSDRLRSNAVLGIWYAGALRRAGTRAKAEEIYLRAGRLFGEAICRRGFRNAAGVYAFNTAALEVFRLARASGLVRVLEQTSAPRAIERELLRSEHERFPGWEVPVPTSAAVDRELQVREEEEWAEATTILAGSPFVRETIGMAGGPVSKVQVVPYGVSLQGPARREPKRRDRSRPLRVVTVGRLSLHKGTPYVIEAAKRLRGEAEFRIVGASAVTASAVAEVRKHVEWSGPVPRSEVADHLGWGDVFLHPSLCEGSPAACLEAMQAGLPVICTPNTGSVVETGRDGVVVPQGDVDSIVAALGEFSSRDGLLEEMSGRCLRRAGDFSVEAYGRRLVAALEAAGSLGGS